MLEAWTGAMDLANEATTTSGNALNNQEKYQESYSGKLQEISTQMDAFWISLYNNGAFDWVLDRIIDLTKAFNALSDTITPLGALIATVGGAFVGLAKLKSTSGGRGKMFPLLSY